MTSIRTVSSSIAAAGNVVGHDHRHGSLRTFRIDRIVSLATGRQTFTVPDGFDPVTHLTSALARVSYRWEVDVLIHGPLDEVARRLPRSAVTLARGMEAWAACHGAPPDLVVGRGTVVVGVGGTPPVAVPFGGHLVPL